MKRFLSLFTALLAFQLSATAQFEIKVTLPDSIVGKVYMQNYVRQAIKDLNLKPSDPVVIVPAKKKCDDGPVIKKLTSVTATSLNLQFHGNGVDTALIQIHSAAGFLQYSQKIAPSSSVITVSYPALSDGIYRITMAGVSCVSDISDATFPITQKPADEVKPTPVPNVESKTIGAYKTKVGGRTYTYNKTPRLALQFNADGTISDITPGLNKAEQIDKLDGRNVFYAIGYGILRNSDGSYQDLQNLYLPDGIYTIRQFVCDPGKFGSIEAFERQFNGWGENAVNINNAQLSEIFLSISSDTKQGSNVVPSWLVVSRKLNFPAVLPAIDWAPYNKTFSTGYINRGDAQTVYQRVGIQPYIDLGNPAGQPNTWHTIKAGMEGKVPDEYLYGVGRHFAERMGTDKRSVITSELGENAQGQDSDIYGRVQLTYKAAMDLYREKGVESNPLYTGLFGDYGSDDFSGFFTEGMLNYSRSTYEKSLTSKLFKGYGAQSNSDFDFGQNDHEFYTRDHIGVRNLNAKYYFWNKAYQLPYEFLYLNEKTKLGTKTWQGRDRERKVSIFTMCKVESFVSDQKTGHKIGVEQSRTGEIIPFTGGEILTRMNSQPPAPWDELFTAGYWSMLLTGGIQIWDAPGSAFGQDTTQIHWWSDQSIQWRPAGGDWQPYSPGQNGAPQNSGFGLIHSLYASPIDAAAAGMEAVWNIRDRIQKLSHASYSSSRGSFKAKPGTAGLTLNGGSNPINLNLFIVRDAADEKKGLAIVGEGPAGSVAIYYNGFLSAHEYEDNVTIKHNGKEINLGRVYGRQTVSKNF
ncbi:hypothetical protein [Dyadobacter sp.]|uniref:hypothetical protein n=1 Tax=Dyadobacter sp. TaxID=1914288 RepID=UPI003F71378F